MTSSHHLLTESTPAMLSGDDRHLLTTMAEESSYKALVDLLQAGQFPDDLLELYGTTCALTEKGETFIMEAVRRNDLSAIQYLAQHGADLEARDDQYNTALLVAAAAGMEEAFQLLITLGARVYATNRKDETALICAAKASHCSCIKLALNAGCHVNLRDTQLNTALVWAARNGLVEAVDILIDAGADVNVINKYCEGALSYAVENGHDQIVDMLLRTNSSVHAINRYGDTFVGAAAKKGKVKLVKFFANLGVDINRGSDFGFTPLICAVQRNFPEVVKVLMDMGADVDASNKYGDTALIVAARDNRSEMVKYLVEGGADCNLPDTFCNTPLMHAAFYGCVEAVKSLVEVGANIDQVNVDGDTALMCSCLSDSDKAPEIIQFLSRSGAQMNTLNAKGFAALHSAAVKGKLVIVKTLLEAGASLEWTLPSRRPFQPRYAGKETALYMAASAGFSDVVKLLLDYGANINSLDIMDRTPLWVATRHGNYKTLQLLLSAGAHSDPPDTDGFTPLMAAVLDDQIEIAEMLIQTGAKVSAGETILQSPLFHACRARHNRRELIKLLFQAGAEIDAELHGVILWQSEQFEFVLPELVLLGALPTLKNTRCYIWPHWQIPPQELSPLAVAFLCGRDDIIRYLFSNWFFNQFDVRALPDNNDIRQHMQQAEKWSTLSLLRDMYSSPWSLTKLSFIAVSTAVGYSRGRNRRIRSLPLPPTFKRKLFFQDSSVKVPASEWSAIVI